MTRENLSDSFCLDILQIAHLAPVTDDRIIAIDGLDVVEYLEDRRTVWEVKNNPAPLDDVTEEEGDAGGWGCDGGWVDDHTGASGGDSYL
jgi:hypothetical protein